MDWSRHKAHCSQSQSGQTAALFAALAEKFLFLSDRPGADHGRADGHRSRDRPKNHVLSKSTPFFIDHGPVRLNRIMDLYLLLLLIH